MQRSIELLLLAPTTHTHKTDMSIPPVVFLFNGVSVTSGAEYTGAVGVAGTSKITKSARAGTTGICDVSRSSLWHPVATMLTSTQTLSAPTEHPCGNHVNVHEDSAHSHKASMWQPC